MVKSSTDDLWNDEPPIGLRNDAYSERQPRQGSPPLQVRSVECSRPAIELPGMSPSGPEHQFAAMQQDARNGRVSGPSAVAVSTIGPDPLQRGSNIIRAAQTAAGLLITLCKTQAIRSIETPRIYHASRRGGCCLAACGACATDEDAGDRVRPQRLGRCLSELCKRVPQGPRRS
jgi:hypothetical protein